MWGPMFVRLCFFLNFFRKKYHIKYYLYICLAAAKVSKSHLRAVMRNEKGMQ